MVKWLLLCASLLGAVDVSVSVRVAAERASEDQPLEAVVAVQRPVHLPVDSMSFALDGQPLEAALLQEATRSSLVIHNGEREEHESVITCFAVQLPPQSPGRHLLPPISVNVGGVIYASPPTAYQVYGTEMSPDFQLHARVEADQKVLYPGDRFRLVYRLIRRYPMETTRSELPLLEPKGFRKVGKLSRQTELQGDVTVETLVQEVEALESGDYVLGRSLLEGYPYQRDYFGRPTFERRRLRAEVEPLTVRIEPLPEQGRPASFEGAVGRFEIATRLLTSAEMAVGDRIRLEVSVSGSGSLATVRLPNLGRLEGFRLSDLPPKVEEGDFVKRFIVEMRPLSSSLQAIPPLTLPHFDPEKGQYLTARSEPIPIQVEALQSPPESPRAPPAPVPVAVAPVKQMGERDLRSPSSSLWGLLVFPAGGGLLLLRRLPRRRKPPLTPAQLFDQAEQRGDLALLQQAVSQLPHQESLLTRIELARFGAGSAEGLFEEASRLFR